MIAISMKLSGKVRNRLLKTFAKFEVSSNSKNGYVKIPILGQFFFDTPGIFIQNFKVFIHMHMYLSLKILETIILLSL